MDQVMIASAAGAIPVMDKVMSEKNTERVEAGARSSWSDEEIIALDRGRRHEAKIAHAWRKLHHDRFHRDLADSAEWHAHERNLRAREDEWRSRFDNANAWEDDGSFDSTGESDSPDTGSPEEFSPEPPDDSDEEETAPQERDALLLKRSTMGVFNPPINSKTAVGGVSLSSTTGERLPVAAEKRLRPGWRLFSLDNKETGRIEVWSGRCSCTTNNSGGKRANFVVLSGRGVVSVVQVVGGVSRGEGCSIIWQQMMLELRAALSKRQSACAFRPWVGRRSTHSGLCTHLPVSIYLYLPTICTHLPVPTVPVSTHLITHLPSRPFIR